VTAAARARAAAGRSIMYAQELSERSIVDALELSEYERIAMTRQKRSLAGSATLLGLEFTARANT